MGRKAISTTKRMEDGVYRSNPAWSYSFLSKYDLNRWGFYKRYVRGEEESDDEESKFLTMGNLVDVFLTDENNFDKQFIITSANKPSGQLLSFTNYVFKLKKQDEEGKKDFIEILKEAYELLKEENGGKLQKLFPTFVENFDKEAKGYYEELVSGFGKKIVTISESTIAKELVSKYENTEAFRFPGCRILTKVPLYFKIGDREFKAEVDKLVFNDTTKQVWGRDIKVSAFIESFFLQGYLKRRYDIQQAIYRFAIESSFPEYKFENFGFEVLDYNNINNPLLYLCPNDYYELTWEGFYNGNKYYKGVMELIEELEECFETDVWHTDIKTFKNKNTIIMPRLISKSDKL